MGRCVSFWKWSCGGKTPMERLALAATSSLRIFYLLFVLTACYGYPGVHDLLGKIQVCDPNANEEVESCTSLAPVINACLMSTTLTTFVIILHTAIDIILKAHGPMRYCCGDSVEYGKGFLAMLRLCVLIVLMQSAVSFLAVGYLVRAFDSFKVRQPPARTVCTTHVPAPTNRLRSPRRAPSSAAERQLLEHICRGVVRSARRDPHGGRHHRPLCGESPLPDQRPPRQRRHGASKHVPRGRRHAGASAMARQRGAGQPSERVHRRLASQHLHRRIVRILS